MKAFDILLACLFAGLAYLIISYYPLFYGQVTFLLFLFATLLINTNLICSSQIILILNNSKSKTEIKEISTLKLMNFLKSGSSIALYLTFCAFYFFVAGNTDQYGVSIATICAILSALNVFLITGTLDLYRFKFFIKTLV